MTDPMGTPPADHGSDRYDYIEVMNAPEGVEPPPALISWVLEPCQDCRANVFIRRDAPDPLWPESSPWPDADGHNWFVAIAHDDTCPKAPPA